MQPLPEPVRDAVEHYRQPSGSAGSVALAMDAEAKRAKLTRAQRNKLPPVIKAMLGYRDGPGRPGGWGPSPYKMDGVLVERVIHRLVSHPDEEAVQTATYKVRLALHDEPHFNEKQWMQNGWLADGAKVLHPIDDDVERIAGKVRATGIEKDLPALRRVWKQLQQVRDNPV